MSGKRVRRVTASRLIALGVLALDAGATAAVLYFCALAIREQFAGSMPYLTTLIGALQASTAVVLAAYYGKSKAENTRGGITYDAALGESVSPNENDL